MALSGSSSRLLGRVGAGLLWALPVYAQSKIAVVDTQRAIMETEEGLRMQATLKKVFDSRQRELDKKQEELAKEREDIEEQRDVLSKAALAKRVDKRQREMVQLQQVFVDYNKELLKKQGELTQPIFQKAMGLIRRVATQRRARYGAHRRAVGTRVRPGVGLAREARRETLCGVTGRLAAQNGALPVRRPPRGRWESVLEKLGGTFEIAIPEQKTPTDIGYDTKRGRVLVPHVLVDTVDVYELR